MSGFKQFAKKQLPFLSPMLRFLRRRWDHTKYRVPVDGIVLSSREDLKKLKPMKKEVPFGKRFLISMFKFLTPLYRSQL